MTSEHQRIPTAVFGGSFDPPHCAHVLAVAYLLTCTGHREVFVVPCFRHAFGKEPAPFRERLRLCRAAFRPFGRRVRVLDVEAHLPAPSYTVQTLRHLVGAFPDRAFTLVVGADILPETPAWREWDEVARLARVLVLRREGFPDPPGSRGPRFPAVSSTAIREALQAGGDASGLVPESVLDTIFKRKLYDAGS